MSQVCKYFQRGHCRYGANCNYLHPAASTPASTVFGGGARNGFGGGTQTKLTDGFTMPTTDSIRVDLLERPTWFLSSYAPGKDPPVQLIDGKDVSPEEARIMAYKLRAEGNPQAYEAEWNRLTGEAETQIRNIVNDLPGAIGFIKNAFEQGAPSRYKSGQAPNQPASPFGSQTAQQGMGAGPAQPSSPFGQTQQPQSAFGQPSQPTSAFGAPSPFGARPAPAFGQSAFGQAPAQQSSATSGFGQPAFGSPSQPQSAFGRSGFGQPAFGQPAFSQSSLGQQSSPFTTVANPAPTLPSAFGQPSTPQTTPAFGQPAFGAASAPKPPFGQPAFGQSAFSQPQASPFAAASSPFAQAATTSTSSPFTQASPAGSVFSQPSQPQNSAPANPFGSTPQQQSGSSPFQQATTQASPSPFSSANPFQQGQQQSTGSPFEQAAQGPSPSTASPFAQANQPLNSFGATVPQPSAFSNQNSFQSGQQGPSSQSQPESHAVNPQLRELQKTKKWDDPVIEYRPAEQAAFAGSGFVLGQVPTVAPGRDMCWG